MRRQPLFGETVTDVGPRSDINGSDLHAIRQIKEIAGIFIFLLVGASSSKMSQDLKSLS